MGHFSMEISPQTGSVLSENQHREEADEVTRLIQEGARIMVCGGRDMANGVSSVLVDILGSTGQTLANLKAEGRYVEDVY